MTREIRSLLNCDLYNAITVYVSQCVACVCVCVHIYSCSIRFVEVLKSASLAKQEQINKPKNAMSQNLANRANAALWGGGGG